MSDLHYLELTEVARRIDAREISSSGGHHSPACAHREAGRPALSAPFASCLVLLYDFSIA